MIILSIWSLGGDAGFFLYLFYLSSYSDSKGLRIDLKTCRSRSLRKDKSLRQEYALYYSLFIETFYCLINGPLKKEID